MKRILWTIFLCSMLVTATACSTQNIKHVDLDAKLVSFESFEEMENYANVIVRVIKEKEEIPIVFHEGNVFVSGFTFSKVKVEKVYKDETGTLQEGNSIRVLENEVFDKQSNTVFHIAGYNMMKEGAPYLLFLKRHIYSDNEEYYVAAGVHFGTVSLTEDGRTIRGRDDSYFRPFWESAKEKFGE